ncbi:MAG: type II secretion system F family protein [Porticoccaceae bacterium]|nr:general secretion pathway protein GspF [Porticoccaceae bacterium]RPG84553.1 MAG: type II secretion system F family protein [Cellvibrionales bacterium TMED47]|tara:strand:- start:5039 stop:6244 length:1206 start_codon:yes stop_codon:yes gene_type:complete
MPTFDYAAYDVSGKLVDGVVSADSERHARRILKEKKLLPSKLSEVASSAPKSRFGRSSKVNEFDLSLVLQQQAILIQSGLPLEDAMRMTIEQAETDRQKRMVESWRSEIIEGRSFSEAMRRSPYKIPESVLAGVGVGEESGHLHTVLMRLAEDIETSAENKKTVTRAMIYPATLLGASMLVVAMMMVWVVPKITAIFISSNRELPTITKIIIAISDFTQQYGLYVLLVGIILVGFSSWFLRDTERRRRWHQVVLSMPGLGRWTTMANVADWSRSLGVLLSNGVPALAALKISSAVVSNLYMRSKMEKVTESMRRGTSLQKALEENQVGSGFLIHMVGSGEASSELDKMLMRVSEYYSLRLSNAVEVFLKLINPILIIFMGGIILSVVAAVMLPIMDMGNMV